MIAALLSVAALALGATPAASPARPILGFQSDGSPPSLISQDASGLGSVGVDGVDLTGKPGAVSAPAASDRAQLAAAHAAGLPAVLLVGNWSDKINDFSEPLAYKTLSSAVAIRKLAAALSDDVKSEGWNGISVDLESLHARDAAGLVTLLADLRSDLGPSASLTMCVSNLTSARSYPANGYDLAGIAKSVSQIVLMAYDQHGPWEKTPGPVGATNWVTRGVRALESSVPAAQVDLGVAGYGYVWGPGGRQQLSDAGARALVAKQGGHARWVASVGEWTATLPSGAVVWWSDTRTLALREALAARLGLHGLAVWSLGLSDPIS
jgi:spore germination protein YaaH